MKISSAALVIYKNAPALVTGFTGDKIAIRTGSGDSKNVREKDLSFVLHPGPANSIPAMPASPSLEDVLPLMEGEVLSFRDFAALVFGDFTPSAALGTWDLLKDSIYFSFDGTEVQLRPPEEIEKALALIREKNEAKERHEALLERIRSNNLLPEDRPSLGEIENVALGITSASRLLRELGIEATPVKAHSLLLKLGIWALVRNPFPARAGVSQEDPAFELPENRPFEREDLTGTTAYAIDDEGSQDPDDAISYSEGMLWVHVADPAAAVEFGSETDLEARERGENLYLPEKITHMLPPEATLRFGLGLQEISPALSFGIRFEENGKPVLEKMCLSRVRVKRLTYATATEILESETFAELQAELEKFRKFREAAGAVFLRLPEVKIRYNAPDIEITPQSVTPEREFVANAMLAAGASVAEWADKNSISMPFVRQEPPDDENRGTSLPEMFALRKSCHPGVTDTIPGPHAGLGLNPYVRVTSPLRRYADLLSHYQLHRYLEQRELLSSDDLTAALRVSEEAAALRRKLERNVNEYWILVYLSRQRPENVMEAVFVYRMDDRAVFLIPSLAYEYKTRFRGNWSPGDALGASVLSVDPPTWTLRLKLGDLPAENDPSAESADA